jgi:hypothetical protein
MNTSDFYLTFILDEEIEGKSIELDHIELMATFITGTV